MTQKLYDEGLEKGRAEADKLVADAKAEAQKIVAEARAEAEEIVELGGIAPEDVRTSGVFVDYVVEGGKY